MEVELHPPLKAHVHEWGRSAACDEVWALVAGRRPSEAGQRLVMALQVYFDESYDRNVFVVAGLISTVEKWSAFSMEWENMLPRFGVLGKDGRYHFHTTEMVENAERKERIGPFWNAICDHVLGGFAVSLFPQDLKQAKDELAASGIVVGSGSFSDPYDFCFTMALSCLLRDRHLFGGTVSQTDQMDVIFDTNSREKKVKKQWELFKTTIPENLIGLIRSDPMFRSDSDFLPLQVADFLSWLVRAKIEPKNQDRVSRVDFKPLDSDLPVLFKHYTKDIIRDMMFASLIRALGGVKP